MTYEKLFNEYRENNCNECKHKKDKDFQYCNIVIRIDGKANCINKLNEFPNREKRLDLDKCIKRKCKNCKDYTKCFKKEKAGERKCQKEKKQTMQQSIR